ncbi:MAG: hypothetical protein HC767_07120 [Akkermansiaceae bacterium]|nr:hypothetical protein [Akkermansiaceae bacterium]
MEEDLRQHLSEEHAEWIALGVGMMGFLNKFMDAMGVELEQGAVDDVGDIIGPTGWTIGALALEAQRWAPVATMQDLFYIVNSVLLLSFQVKRHGCLVDSDKFWVTRSWQESCVWLNAWHQSGGCVVVLIGCIIESGGCRYNDKRAPKLTGAMVRHHCECAGQHEWPYETGTMKPQAGARPPKPDSLAVAFPVLLNAPGAIRLDKKWQAGVPHSGAEARKLIAELGFDEPLLESIGSSRARRYAVQQAHSDSLYLGVCLLQLESGSWAAAATEVQRAAWSHHVPIV